MSIENTPFGTHKIAFIGAGNMARSLMGGLISQGYPPENISCSDPNEHSLAMAEELGNIQTSIDNSLVIQSADFVVLAVKPQLVKDVLYSLKGAFNNNKVILISIAAGINCKSLNNWLNEDIRIVRCMPNTPALVQSGVCGMYATNDVDILEKKLIFNLMSAVGVAIWLDSEEQLDAVTAISGSGPAYFFLFMEALKNMGQELGLKSEMATILTQQTALGAAKMAIDSDEELSELRRKVTSPNGTTHAAIQFFENNNFSKTINGAVKAAYERSKSLTKEFE